MKRLFKCAMALAVLFYLCECAVALDEVSRDEKRKQDMEKLQEKFSWWPTDAQPAPVKDQEHGGIIRSGAKLLYASARLPSPN
jgi:hypothetical protein